MEVLANRVISIVVASAPGYGHQEGYSSVSVCLYHVQTDAITRTDRGLSIKAKLKNRDTFAAIEIARS